MCKRLLPMVVLSILLASTLVGCDGGGSSPCPSTLTILSITEGDVSVMKEGTDDWMEAEVETELEVGDTVKTGNDSGAEITFFDGNTMELEAGTEIEVVSLDLSCDTGVTTITLEQTIGTTISRVEKLLDPASSYEVETPTGVAGVRGSTMTVTVGGNGTTLVTNLEGDIYVGAQGVELQVPEGQQGIIVPEQPPNLMPLAEDYAASTDEDTSVTVAAPGVLSNDSDSDAGDTLTVASINTSATLGAVTAWDADGSFTYDPNGQFEYLQAGGSTTDSFTYTVSDGNGGTDTAAVIITVNGVNDVPTGISLSNSSVAENQPSGTAVGDFSTTDADTGDTFIYSLVSGEGGDDNASFTIADSQLQTDASFDYETKNSYSIRVRTTDSGTLYYEETFNITVTNVNDPPVAVADNATTLVDNPVTIYVLNNDSDVDGDALTIDSVTQGANGLVANNGTYVTYTPDLGFNGTDSFNYTVSDGNGGTDTATVTVNIPTYGIKIELTWNTGGTDLDAHLIRPSGQYWDIPDDCHWRNKNPDWGLSEVTEDNPSLDQDDVNGYGPENITLEQPYEQGIYQYIIHYWYDWGHGPSTATVRVWINDVKVAEYSKEMSNDEVWNCCFIEWPSGQVNPTQK